MRLREAAARGLGAGLRERALCAERAARADPSVASHAAALRAAVFWPDAPSNAGGAAAIQPRSTRSVHSVIFRLTTLAAAVRGAPPDGRSTLLAAERTTVVSAAEVAAACAGAVSTAELTDAARALRVLRVFTPQNAHDIFDALTARIAGTAPPVALVADLLACLSSQRLRHLRFFKEAYWALNQRLIERQDARVASPEAESETAHFIKALYHLTLLDANNARIRADIHRDIMRTVRAADAADAAGPPPLSFQNLTYWTCALFFDRLDRVPRLSPDFFDLAVLLARSLSSLDAEHLQSLEYRSSTRRCLLVAYGLKYLKKAVFEDLPRDARRQFERVIALQPPGSSVARAGRSLLARQVSRQLTKLRVAHRWNALRGPLTADLIERDQAVVYLIGTPSSYFYGTRDRTPFYNFRIRLFEALGYRVAAPAWWQLNRLRNLRARREFLRMLRYYCTRDRRCFDPDFEGWTLPSLDITSSKAVAIEGREPYFPAFIPHGLKRF